MVCSYNSINFCKLILLLKMNPGGNDADNFPSSPVADGELLRLLTASKTMTHNNNLSQKPLSRENNTTAVQ
jgi:hypothetical protein